MPLPTYLFYDLETSGLSPAFDQILQFAAVRVDTDFNEIERFNIRVKLSPDIIPNPAALLVNRVLPADFANGLDEYDAVKKIHEIMNRPGTISLGYNTLGFDDEFLRFSFFRHLLSPYTHQHAHDCFRMDIYPMVLLAHHIKPELLHWPMLDGKVSYKLENLVRENNLSAGQSHDALVDVLDTIALAKKLKSDAEFWNKASLFFSKKYDIQLIDTCVTRLQHDDAVYPYGFFVSTKPGKFFVPVLSLGRHAHYKNQTIWLPLDQIDYSRVVDDAGCLNQVYFIRKKDAEPPFFFPYHARDFFTQDPELNKTLIEKNLQFLRSNPSVFSMIQSRAIEKQYPQSENYEVNAALYKLPFSTEHEASLFRRFHLISTARKLEVVSTFSQAAHRELGVRLLGRHQPALLTEVEKNIYQTYLRTVFSATPDTAMQDHCGKKKLTLSGALEGVEKLMREKTQPHEQRALLEMQKWYQGKCEQYAPVVDECGQLVRVGFFRPQAQVDHDNALVENGMHL